MEGSGKILASELRYMFRQGKDIENYMKIVQRLKELVNSAGLSGRLSGIWQEKAGLSGKAYTDNPVGYPTTGKKNQIRPNLALTHRHDVQVRVDPSAHTGQRRGGGRHDQVRD